MTEQVKCRKCLTLKLSSEYTKSKLAHGDYICRVCDKELLKQYKLENKDKIKLSSKLYYEKNKKLILQKHKDVRAIKGDLLNKKTKEWRLQNKTRVQQYNKIYRERNLHKLLEFNKNYKLQNKQKIKKYCEENRYVRNKISAKYRCSKKNAVPNWLTDIDVERIKNVYKLAELQTKITGYKWHVDHIIPLQGKNVCGLHVPSNLRAIPWLENVKKGNKLMEKII